MRRVATVWIVCLGWLVSCRPVVSGNGDTQRDERQVAAFDQVELGGPFDLVLTQGASRRLVVIADSNLQPLVTTEVRGSVLKIDLTKNVEPDVGLEIQTPHLKRVVVSGAADVQLVEIQSDELRIEVSGAAAVKASGTVRRLDVEGSGAMDLDAAQLRAEVVVVELSGAGSAVVHAVRTLAAKISGAGSVVYKGKPVVTQEISGVGSIRAIDP